MSLVHRAGRHVVPLFVGLALLFGGLLILTVPPFGGSDELYHWFRIQQIADGTLLAERRGDNDWGGPVDAAAVAFDLALFGEIAIDKTPLSAAEVARLAAELDRQPAATVDLGFASTASFPPLAYAPSSAGLWLARALGGDPLAQFLAARAGNLLAYGMTMGAVIGLLPAGRLALTALALSPVALHQAASLSADPLNLTIPLLLAAALWSTRRAAGPISIGRRTGIAVLCMALAGLKPLSPIFALLLILLPGDHMGGARNKALYGGLLAAVTVALSIAWQAAHPFQPGLFWGISTDRPTAVLAALAAAPAHALGVAWSSLASLSVILPMDGYFRIGGHAAPYVFPPGLSLPPMTVADAETAMAGGRALVLLIPALSVWSALVILAALDGREAPDRRGAGVLGTVALLFSALLFAAFWLAYTPIASPMILGLQGRYFLLPATLALMAVSIASRPRAGWAVTLRGALFGALLAANAAVILWSAAYYHTLWDWTALL